MLMLMNLILWRIDTARNALGRKVVSLDRKCRGAKMPGRGDSTRVFEREYIQFMRDAEDDVEVVGRQHFSFASGQPALTRLRLALGAMPVTARVIRDGLLAAVQTSINMAS